MKVRTVFTSQLQINSSDKEFEESLYNDSFKAEYEINSLFSYFDKDSEIHRIRMFPRTLSNEYILRILDYSDRYCGGQLDLTSCLKGYFMYLLLGEKDRHEYPDFIIDFGGDIVGKGQYKIPIERSFTVIDTNDCFAIFSSGNNEKRGNHIKGTDRKGTITEIFWNVDSFRKLADWDCYATLRFAGTIGVMEFCQELFIDENTITHVRI